jgi:gingipain R
VQTQVQRTLDYEKEPDITTGSFKRAMCIASNQGPGDDSEYDYQHQQNIRTDYMGFTYNYGAELYDGSQGGADAAGNPNSAMVASELNTGIGIISYTGHGSTTSWGTTGFSNSGVNSLTNNTMLPFILSVACVNGNFVYNTCFAEAWLRATYNGQPSGAIAAFMSTINQSWNPPMRGQDEMVDILAESYPANIRRTFGGICMNGCMNMNDVYGSGGSDMTDTWTIFGDPSLMVRTADPATMVVSHLPVLTFGSGQLSVSCDQEGARVAISNYYQLLGAGIISDGSVDISFAPINTEDTLIVTVTAFNCLPAADEVYIMPPGCWLGITSEWNNPSNWSDGVVPGPGCCVTIPDILLGEFYPSDFSGTNPVMDQLIMEDGSSLSVPGGVTITVGSGR